ncbi:MULTISPECIES: DoxX family protein [Rhodomicrobium]|uniref:DoxX family protein n=1 Tax=Rhodomicrobium TaxID=1068 RepID=UPI001482E49D|nr:MULTISPECIES: DoxX family protein [Rhodomicrobium]
MNNLALLIGRWALATAFVVSGAGKFLGGIEGVAGTLAAKGLPYAMPLAIVAAAVELGGGLLVVLGFQTRLAALALIVFTIAATYLFHNFWAVDPAQYQAQFVHFLKNLSIIGGFLVLVAAGPGRISVDGARG